MPRRPREPVHQLRQWPPPPRCLFSFSDPLLQGLIPASSSAPPLPPPLSALGRPSSSTLLDYDLQVEAEAFRYRQEDDMQWLLQGVVDAEEGKRGGLQEVDSDEDRMLARELCDVNLLLDDGTRIRAHGAVLAARCHFFRAALRSGWLKRLDFGYAYNFLSQQEIAFATFHPSRSTGMRESQSREIRLSLGGVLPSQAAVEALLRFIYTDSMEITPEVSCPVVGGNDRLKSPVRP